MGNVFADFLQKASVYDTMIATLSRIMLRT